MLFCPKCQSLLIPKEGKMHCSCGYTQEEGKLTEKKKKTKDVAVVEKKQVSVHAKTKADCKECGNNEAYFWTQQTRSADEPETRFFKCTKCEITWREY